MNKYSNFSSRDDWFLATSTWYFYYVSACRTRPTKRRRWSITSAVPSRPVSWLHPWAARKQKSRPERTPRCWNTNPGCVLPPQSFPSPSRARQTQKLSRLWRILHFWLQSGWKGTERRDDSIFLFFDADFINVSAIAGMQSADGLEKSAKDFFGAMDDLTKRVLLLDSVAPRRVPWFPTTPTHRCLYLVFYAEAIWMNWLFVSP